MMVALLNVFSTPWCEYLLSHNLIRQHFILSELVLRIINASHSTKDFRKQDQFSEVELLILILINIDFLDLNYHLDKFLYTSVLIDLEADMNGLIIRQFGVILLKLHVAALGMALLA